MERTFETLLVSTPADHVTLLTLNRPQASNAFNTKMAEELFTFFEGVAMEPGSCRVIVITGSGDKAFCAGGDLKERLDMSDEAWFAQHLIYERMARAILTCPLPIMGAINGAAYGGGAEIVAALDIVYMADHAKLAQTEVKLGIIPGAGGTQTLARAVGERRAMELILSGRPFSAKEALDWGLANAIMPLRELMDTAMKTASSIAANAPIAVKQAKQAIKRGGSMALMDGLAMEIECYNRTVTTQDRREGITAFNEKRKPLFKGR